jgi:hypothetical protein
MKLDNFSGTDVSGDEFDGKDVGINTERMGFIFDLLSSQIYRRPHESIVREITSNCFDSHIEANVNDPVIIKIKEDEAGWYISFNDFGVGLSPDRIEKIYTNLGESTKRESNKFIGAFGLGSKSPFSYTDNFFINTNFNGTRYEYLLYKGKNAVPRLEKIVESETTDRNGTEIRIYFKEIADRIKFINACRSELIYFDNVYFDFNCYEQINNDYVIFDRQHFKYCPQRKYSDQLHIVLGKVSYPIDWVALGRSPIHLPIGLKFNIGELPVTPERESVRYVKFNNDAGVELDTAEIIRGRIASLQEELVSIYNEQVKDKVDSNDLVEFCNNRYITADIEFKSARLNQSWWLSINDLAETIFRKYQPLSDFGAAIPDNPLFEYVTVAELDHKGNFKPYIDRSKNPFVRHLVIEDIENCFLLRYPSSGKFDKKKSLYVLDLARDMGVHGPIKFIKRRKETSAKFLLNILSLSIGKAYKNKSKNRYSTNIVGQVKMYREHIHSFVNENSISYESLQIPNAWLEAYKLRNRAKRETIGDEEIIVYNYGSIEERFVLHLKDIQKFTGFLIYGHEEDEFFMRNFKYILKNSKYANSKKYPYNTLDPLKCRLYRTAKKNAKVLNQFSNCIHVSDFMSNNKVFKNIATAMIIEKKNKSLKLENKVKESKIKDLDKLMQLIFPPVADAYAEIEQFCKDFGLPLKQQNIELVPAFKSEVIDLAIEQGLYKQDLVALSDKIDRYFKGLELLSYLDINEESLPHIIKFFKLSNKTVHDLWNNIDYYLDMMKSYQSKTDYLMEILNEGNKNSNLAYSKMSYSERTKYDSNVSKTRTSCSVFYQDLNLLINYHELTTQN